MKNNVLMLAIVGIAVLFTIAVALYGASTALMPDTPQDPPAQDDDDLSGNVSTTDDALFLDSGDVRTAYGSLSKASEDVAVRQWLADKNIVYVAGIASDFCAGGLSDQWTITYASDDGQFIACVVKGTVVDVHESQSTPLQGIDPRLAIDSDRAWDMVSDDIQASGGTMPESASMKLIIIGGKPCWDVSYQSPDGYRIVRVDAGSGTISGSATIGP